MTGKNSPVAAQPKAMPYWIMQRFVSSDVLQIFRVWLAELKAQDYRVKVLGILKGRQYGESKVVHTKSFNPIADR